jgi:4-amino-4-deoxy-L-arabinose transferase-like glycosyltransferase
MLVSALLLVRYLYGGGRVHQLLSGAFAGLAFLTKSPAGFLIPYAALATAFCHLKVRFAQNSLSGRASKARAWGRWLWAVARDLGVWGLAAVCVFVLAWPAMWVMPGEILSKMWQRIVFYVETVHRNPNFFAGQVIGSDAGPLFYLATIAWKTTLVTLPALLATVPFLLWRTKRERNVGPVWWVLAYACGFMTAMTFAARKEIRYLIPRASACPRTASHSETFR